MIDQPLGDTLSRSTLPAPPKTRGLPLVGSLPALVRRSFDFLLAARAHYGDIYTLDLGLFKLVMLNHPRHVEHVLVHNNRQIIRFEPFKVQNGPDLYVYLSGHPMPRTSAQLHEQGTFEVARLKGNIGDQNYELPADLDLSQYRAVVIYCKRFSEIFSTAELLTVQN